MICVGLSAGHHYADSGAVYRDLREHLLTLKTLGYVIPTLVDGGIYPVLVTGRLTEKVSTLKKYPLKCAVEIHYNSSTNSTAQGVEIVHHPGSTGGEVLANRLYDGLVNLSFTSPRRVVDSDELGRSLYFLRSLPCPSVIVEPLWISNPVDQICLRDNSKLEAIGVTVAHSIIDFVRNYQ